MAYSVKEVSKMLLISERAITKRCFKSKVRKINNRYSIENTHIEQWKKDIQKNLLKEPVLGFVGTGTQVDIEVESLKEHIKKLEEELQQYEVNENERIEVFTNEEYSLFETRLKEWQLQRQELEHQEQIFKIEQKSTKEILEHYKNQFEYQKKQNDKILDMHQKLLDTIENQNKLAIQRNIIEASEKDVINPANWKRKE